MLGDSGADDVCGAAYDQSEIELSLDAADQAYLGSFDFELAVVCDDRSVYSSHETFVTTNCEC